MKKVAFIPLFILFFCFCSAQNNSSGTQSFSLPQAIDYAIQNQATVQNSALDAGIARQRVKELVGVGLPQIKGSIDAKKFIDIPTQAFRAQAFNPQAPADAIATAQFGLDYSATAGLEASQLIFDGSYVVGLQASRTYEELSKKNYEQSKIETASIVSKAYYNVLVNDERMNLIYANVTRIKKLRDDTKAMYDNGFVEKIDFDRIELTYNNILTEKDKTEKLLVLAKDLLKFQMGMDMKTNLILSDSLSGIAFDEAFTTNENVDVSRRIEYSIMQSNMRLQELDLKKNRFAYLPSLVAYAAVSGNAYRLEFDFLESKKWYPTTIVGATISMPIFDGLQRRSRINQSKLNLKKVENGMRSLEQGLTLETKNAQVQLQNSISSLQTQRKNRELAGEVARVSKAKYDQGVGSNLEVVNAETSLKEAETNYYSALYDALVAKIDYAKATGTLTK